MTTASVGDIPHSCIDREHPSTGDGQELCTSAFKNRMAIKSCIHKWEPLAHLADVKDCCRTRLVWLEIPGQGWGESGQQMGQKVLVMEILYCL